jgi:hypothetical protein
MPKVTEPIDANECPSFEPIAAKLNIDPAELTAFVDRVIQQLPYLLPEQIYVILAAPVLFPEDLASYPQAIDDESGGDR